ncbi:MAG TPA: cupredoxin domain-containing protein [Acidimicrobiales bacterium]|nr:cupredoxin domain-containing protein [Acidimicrobiales bacterium]
MAERSNSTQETRSPVRKLTPKTLAVAALTLVAFTLTACGGGDSNTSTATTQGGKTINIEMRDIAFSPNTVSVKAGEKVRFVFHNAGKIKHDAFIGDEQAQDDHEMEMRQTDTTGMNGMGGMSDDSTGSNDGITVEPGKTGELTHTFQAGDDVLIACHEAGHYAAGMKITVAVS